MMKVVGEEGTSLADYTDYLKAEFLDFVYLQQNAYDPVDEATPRQRQEYVFSFISRILSSEFTFGTRIRRCTSSSSSGSSSGAGTRLPGGARSSREPRRRSRPWCRVA